MRRKKEQFDFDQLPNIIGAGIVIIEREIESLAAKSQKQGLTETESKTLISYLSVLREIKKDYLTEVATVQKELKSLTTEELTLMLNNQVAS